MLRSSTTILSLFAATLLGGLVGACSDDGEPAEPVYCIEPEFVEGQPLEWSTCGCNSYGEPWRETCFDGGLTCQGSVHGETCSPHCDAANPECPPFLGRRTECKIGSQYCHLPCESDAECPAPLRCNLEPGMHGCYHDYRPPEDP